MARRSANQTGSTTRPTQPTRSPSTPKTDLTPRALQRLQNLVWVLIYGGLLALVLGVATRRAGDDAVGWGLVISGGAAAAVGGLLMVVRARLHGSAER